MSRPVHVVLIHRYFYPDTPPYASILKQIAEGLAGEGSEVSVLTCQPSYNRDAVKSAPSHEQLAPNVSVTRWAVISDRKSTWAKGVNLLTFGARVALALGRMKRVDAVMAASTPPVFLAMITSLVAKAKGVPFVYHKQDIYPEVTDANGGLPSLARQLLRAVDARTDRRAEKVVVLSEDMAHTAVERGARPESISVINNFDPWPPVDMQDVELEASSEAVRFVYAGNLGRFQNLEVLAAAMQRFKGEPRVTFDFIGDGPMRSWLQSFAEKNTLVNVRMHGYVEPTRLAEMLQTSFDVGIVSLYPGVIRAAYPSKTMSYLRNGLPVLALVESDAELVRSLSAYAAGWSADPASPSSLDSAVSEIIRARHDFEPMRRAARKMYEQEFGREGQLSKWKSLFASVVSGQS